LFPYTTLFRSGLTVRAPAGIFARPGHMRGTLSVAGFAADADLGPFRGERVFRRVVILAHAGRVTFGAHEIPVLVELRPMQDVVMPHLLVGVEVEPALTALVLRAAVPGDRERLQTTVGKLNQVLLQRSDAECPLAGQRALRGSA